MGAAAFFDLDRTLLKGASGPYVTAALGEVGLVDGGRVPGDRILYRLYDTVGETLPAMLAVRMAATATKGWSLDAARKAGDTIAELLADRVAPYAHGVIEEHRAAGRTVVLATTTPYDLVEPFARSLGFDDVIATRYAVRDGSYTGKIDGPFVWSLGKLGAVRSWARNNGVDLRESYAYSDSFYDVPLLSATGNPVAVNPDPRLRVFAMVRRWPVLHLDAPPGVPKIAGMEPYDVLRHIVRPELFPYARFDIDGVSNIPSEGAAIVVSNHRSYFDVAAVALVAAQSGRPMRFLAKKEVCDAPVVGQIARALGAIRVERGSGSDKPLEEARRVIEAGEVAGIFPQGTIPRGKAFFDPVLHGRTGAARLVSMTGAPVVPMAVWGSEKVWPRRSRVPLMTNVTDPPSVRVRVGTPIDAAALPTGAVDATEAIMDAITGLLPPEAGVAYEPTPEEIESAMPPGAARGN